MAKKAAPGGSVRRDGGARERTPSREHGGDAWHEGAHPRARVETMRCHLWAHAYEGALWWHKGRLGKVIMVERMAPAAQTQGRDTTAWRVPVAVVLAESKLARWPVTSCVWDHDESRLCVIAKFETQLAEPAREPRAWSKFFLDFIRAGP